MIQIPEASRPPIHLEIELAESREKIAIIFSARVSAREFDAVLATINSLRHNFVFLPEGENHGLHG